MLRALLPPFLGKREVQAFTPIRGESRNFSREIRWRILRPPELMGVWRRSRRRPEGLRMDPPDANNFRRFERKIIIILGTYLVTLQQQKTAVLAAQNA